MKKYLILVLTVFMVACSFNKTPDYVIPQDDMVDIIVDIHLMDGLMSVRSIQEELTQADTSNYYDLIFEKYGYSRADFDTSVFYYGKNINKYDKIYEEVLNELTSLDADIKEENRLKEDIRK